jgi:hypothetical protein
MKKKEPITSTAEFAQTVLTAKTPDLEPAIFTQDNFLSALKKVSRRQEKPPAEPGEDKPTEDKPS